MKIIILSRKPNLYSTKRLVEAGQKLGHDISIIDHTKCNLIMEKAKPAIRVGSEYIKDVDIIIPRIGASVTVYGAAVIRQFDLMGEPSTLTSTALIRSRDKLRSLQILSKSGVGIPKSVFARHPKADDVKVMIEEAGGTPVILKLLEGTHGTGVIKADSVSSAKSAVEAFSGIKKDIIVQEFIEEAKGKDIRAFVVDGEVVGAMERSGQGDEFRSNLHKGGIARPIELTVKEKAVAIEAANLHGLTVAGVDMLISARGPLIIEVNSSPGLQGIERATGVDIAGKIIEAAEKKISKKIKDKEKSKGKKKKKKKVDNNE
ncbi:MAG: Alpha-L-glutamate ligase [Patescibacteria group bacterium]|nr:Alpha-L-glutamate ligase [Patescibacteria group bacterium]